VTSTHAAHPSDLNVLYLTNSPYLGGTGRILQSWITLGRGRGVRGRLAVRPSSDLLSWARAEGIDAFVDDMPWPDRWRPHLAIWHAWRVWRWARRFDIDIIHCNEHNVYPFALVLRRWLRKPVVCHVRYTLDRGFAEWAFSGDRAPAALLWTSETQRRDSVNAVEGIVPEQIQHTVRLGIDLAHFGCDTDAREATRSAWRVSPDDVLIVTASPLRPRKRVEDFVRLIVDVSARHPNVAGVIAGGTVPGEEEYERTIQRAIAESRLGPRLQWIGYLEPVEPLYQAGDIVVSTSEYETFGNSVCEAMACGRPVAAYSGGSVQEVVGDAGLIVATPDYESLLESVERLIVDSQLRRDLGGRARQRVADTFSPSASFDQLLRIYRTVSRT
jgi:glycosyltransferase involved in cell wall biosynthesis